MNATLRFRPDDTWHFAGPRAHDDGALGETLSLFPPSAWTVAGAVRTLIGDELDVDWDAFGHGDGRRHRLGAEIDLIDQIGFGDDLGLLRLTGPWLSSSRGRLYPAPFFLGKTPSGGLARLRPGEPVECDLGRVRLPAAADPGISVLERCWLTETGFRAVMRGELPAAADCVEHRELIAEESRLGIELDKAAQVTVDGQLYQTQHLRPVDDALAVEVGISGVAAELLPGVGSVRFGGEGRVSRVEIAAEAPALPAPVSIDSSAAGLMLVLLTHADFEGTWLPPGAEALEREAGWRVNIGGVELIVRSAAVGRAVREGGWNLAKRLPRPVRSLVPAGSVWYCEVPDGDLPAASEVLHGIQCGRDQALGRGMLAVGLWTHDEHPGRQE